MSKCFRYDPAMNFRPATIAATIAAAALLAGCNKHDPAHPPAAAAPAPKGDAVVLFNGRDLQGWKRVGRLDRDHWKVGTARLDPHDRTKLLFADGGAELVNTGIVGADLATEQTFGDARIELEFMIPAGTEKVPANSGVFVMGEYELQIMDDPSTDRDHPGDMDQGAVVRTLPPHVLSSLPPGQWQKYEIDYRAPRFDTAGKKKENAKLVKVVLNGQTIHENVELPGPTPGGLTDAEHPTGPIILQGSEGQVAFRTIMITPK